MAYQPSLVENTNPLVPDTPPTTYNAASPDGSPVSITLPGQSAIGRQPGYYNVGLDNPWGALVIMAPNPIRPFADGEAITLSDANNNVIAIRNAAGGTSAPAYLTPGGTYTATATGWTGGGFALQFIGQ